MSSRVGCGRGVVHSSHHPLMTDARGRAVMGGRSTRRGGHLAETISPVVARVLKTRKLATRVMPPSSTPSPRDLRAVLSSRDGALDGTRWGARERHGRRRFDTRRPRAALARRTPVSRVASAAARARARASLPRVLVRARGMAPDRGRQHRGHTRRSSRADPRRSAPRGRRLRGLRRRPQGEWSGHRRPARAHRPLDLLADRVSPRSL